VTIPKSVNRSVYEGADLISLRLRSARKPAVIPFLEIPPEEIDLEPVTIEPVSLSDTELISIKPLVVPLSDILPFDDDEPPQIIPLLSESPLPAPMSPVVESSTPLIHKPPSPTSAPASTSSTLNEGLSFFGVGVIETKKRSNNR
jgi:hypothetical protein